MNPQFYVARQGHPQRQGPFTREQLEQGLHAGQFAPGDLAWQTGTSEWIPLSTLLMPALPDMPPLPTMPEMPPLPTQLAPSGSSHHAPPSQGSVPPPPPFERSSGHVPPPPAYSAEARPPWSPLGLIGCFLALAGIGLAVWFLLELWEKFPATREPMLTEAPASGIVGAFGVAALLTAFPLLGSKHPRRGRGWAVAAVVLGGLVAVAGIGGAALASSWASIRYKTEESSARADLIGLGRYCHEYAQAHGGRFPDTVQELRTNRNADVQMSYFFEYGSNPRSVQITPGLTVNSPGDTVLLMDTWASGRGQRAVYNVKGEISTRAVPLTGGSGVAPFSSTPTLVPANGGVDLTTPEKCFQSLVAAARLGDVGGVRRCMTEKGFSKEFADFTPDHLRREFSSFTCSVKSVGAPSVNAQGLTTVKVVISFVENGRTDEDTATFVQRGQDWLLEAM